MNNLERIETMIKHIQAFGCSPRILRFFLESHLARAGKMLELKIPRYRHPVWMRSSTSDVSAFGQVMIEREYDIDLGFIPEIIIDCGANIGLATLAFKNRYPDAQIISLEPEASNYTMLLKNTARYDAIHPLQAGIWWRNARLVIEDTGAKHWAFTVREAADNEPDAIEALSISDIIERFDLPRIDVLKMDIEGSEKEVFSRGFEQWLPKVRVLIIELHDRMKPGCSVAFFKALQGYDYSTGVSGEHIVVFFNHK